MDNYIEPEGFLQKVIRILFWIGSVLYAIARTITKPIFRIAAWYNRMWLRLVYNKYDELVYKRAIGMIFVTIAFVIILPAMTIFLGQATYLLATYKKDTVYLIKSEEIIPERNMWAITGSRTKELNPNESLYFRVEASFIHHVWSILHNGTLFIPDEIGSSVPTGVTKFEIITYGIRYKSLMNFNLYPNILEVKHAKNGTESPEPIEARDSTESP